MLFHVHLKEIRYKIRDDQRQTFPLGGNQPPAPHTFYLLYKANCIHGPGVIFMSKHEWHHLAVCKKQISVTESCATWSTHPRQYTITTGLWGTTAGRWGLEGWTAWIKEQLMDAILPPALHDRWAHGEMHTNAFSSLRQHGLAAALQASLP